MNLNKVSLIGNLTKEPIAKSIASGQELSRFTVATNYLSKNKSGSKKVTDFHSIVAWGGLARVANQYLKKGSKVYVEGRLQNSSWEDKAKVKHYKTEIIAQELIMLDSKKKEVLVEVEEVPFE